MLLINKILRAMGFDIKPSKSEMKRAMQNGWVTFSKDVLKGTYSQKYLDTYFLVLHAQSKIDEDDRKMLIEIAERSMMTMCRSGDLDVNLYGISGLKLLNSKHTQSFAEKIAAKNEFVIVCPPGARTGRYMLPKEAVQIILNSELPKPTRDDWELAKIPMI
ncbi:TPA: hypothetical protein RI785_003091 [Vibrio cholerae]|nr:hypothetical protein [Vibrio cholerae]